MIIQVDPQSAEPIYEQVAFQVKRAAARGEIAAGDKLPSVRELARDLAINPNTVIRAYDTLERDGVIIRRKGSGCFATGKSSELAAPRRREELRDLLRKTVIEAFHLGFSETDIRKAFEQHLAEVRFDQNGTAARPSKGAKKQS